MLAEFIKKEVCRDNPRKYYRAIDPSFEDCEVEELILYPAVLERLKKRDIPYFTGYGPDSIPADQI